MTRQEVYCPLAGDRVRVLRALASWAGCPQVGDVLTVEGSTPTDHAWAVFFEETDDSLSSEDLELISRAPGFRPPGPPAGA